MYYHLFILPINIVLIIIYTISRSRFTMEKVKFIQPLMTLMALLLGIGSFLTLNHNTVFSIWISLGLLASFITDCFHIDMRKDNILMIGIIGFTIAYMLYPIGITILTGFKMTDIPTAVPLLILYILILRKFWNPVRNFRIPVIIYTLVCPFMVHRAASTFFSPLFSTTQALMLTIGTLALYLGDVEYGFHRFVKERSFLVGHICYGTGQVLIALSASLFIK